MSEVEIVYCDSLQNLLFWMNGFHKLICIYFYEKGFIGDSILACQDIYWNEFGINSRFSHVGFMGTDNFFYESTVDFNLKNTIYGIYSESVESRIKKWYKYDKLAVQVFPTININQWDVLTASAKKNVGKIEYGGLELFGTLWTLIRWKLTFDKEKKKRILMEKNIFDSTKAQYCVSFVVDEMEKNLNIELCPGTENSVLTVDHLWNTNAIKTDRFIIEKKN